MQITTVSGVNLNSLVAEQCLYVPASPKGYTKPMLVGEREKNSIAESQQKAHACRAKRSLVKAGLCQLGALQTVRAPGLSHAPRSG